MFASLKGQIMSESINEIINFQKYNQNNLIDFCPGRFYRLGACNLFWLLSRRLYSVECKTYLVWTNFQGRNLSNFFGGILENQWFHKYILTSSDLYLFCIVGANCLRFLAFICIYRFLTRGYKLFLVGTVWMNLLR